MLTWMRWPGSLQRMVRPHVMSVVALIRQWCAPDVLGLETYQVRVLPQVIQDKWLNGHGGIESGERAGGVNKNALPNQGRGRPVKHRKIANRALLFEITLEDSPLVACGVFQRPYRMTPLASVNPSEHEQKSSKENRRGRRQVSDVVIGVGQGKKDRDRQATNKKRKTVADARKERRGNL